MHGETLALDRLDRFIWATVALIAATVLAAPIVSDFYIAWHAFIAPGVACIVLVGAASFYRNWRTDPRLASAP